MKNKRPTLNLQYNWILYLAVIVIAILWWSLAFQSFHAPTAEERVSVFFAGDTIDYSLADSLQQIYDIRLVEIHSCNPNATEFATKFSVVGLNSCNIIILPKTIAEKTYCAESFVDLRELGLPTQNAYLQNDLSDANNPVPVPFGIYLDNQLLSKHFSIQADCDYYLFVAGSALNDDGKLYPRTLEVINYFLQKVEANV